MSGSLREYNNQGRELLDTIENSEHEDVLIYNMPDGMGIYGFFGLSEDKSYWFNTAVAGYYNKRSVRVISK